MAPSWLTRLTRLTRTHREPSPPRVYLHIGATKTGTTFLQGLLAAHQDSLAAAGCLYPGSEAEQDFAVRDALWDVKDPRIAARVKGQWARIREAVLEYDGTCSVISRETLGAASAEQAREVVESLAGVEVHVVITTRDAAKTLPGQWQTSCRNGEKINYQHMVRAVRHILDGDEGEDVLHPRAVEILRTTQWIPQMLDVWVPQVGANRVHLITVPAKQSDPMLLWKRFAGVIGIDPSVCTAPPADANPSLGHASAEVVRRVNVRLGNPHKLDYRRVVRGHLARQVLAPRGREETPVRLNRRARVLANRWNRAIGESANEHGVDVVGDLAELPVVPPGDEFPEDLPRPTTDELLAAASCARDGMLELRSRLTARLSGEDETAPDDAAGPTSPARWADEEEPVTAAVDEVADLCQTCIELHRRLDDRQSPTAVDEDLPA